MSLLSNKDQGTRFFWPAITGEWRERVGGGTPRDFGPCGIVLDRDCTQLFARPERYYPYIRGLEPVIEEALLAPFYVAGKAVGTVWVLSHDSNRHFDTEDQRQLESIAAFASGAYQVVESIGALEEKITERKRAEQGLLDADRRKNEFLAMLAHELRNPLAPIRNGVRILEQGVDPTRLAPIVEMMHRQVDIMTRLIEDLLDVSRVSQGKIDLRRERIDLIEVLRQAIDANRPAIERHKHELTLTLPGRPVYLQADATRLAQVLGNLLNNACKFTNRGGHIHVIVELRGAETQVRVRDSGIGLSAEQVPRVFDLFAQADTSLERPESGLGIGLTLVKRLVEMHGGSVRVASEGLGHGAEFIVQLPVAPDYGPTDGKPDAAQPVTRHRVLIVDDNRDAAETLAMLLQLDGHEARVTVMGEEALEVIDQGFEPDFVLLDIGLPGMNGYEVARQIRGRHPGLKARLIALTGWGQADDRTRSLEAGFDDQLIKPADSEALAKLLADDIPRL